MGGFCETLLPSDRWPWSDVSGLQHRPLDGVALPSPHWEWESDWYVDENFGGEPTEKGVGELGSCRRAPPSPQCCPQRPVSLDLALGPARSLLAGRGPWVTLQATRCLPALLPSRSPFPSSFLAFPGKLPEAPPTPTLMFQGWTYAIDFPATYTRDKKWNSCVRRRRWIRYRRYKSQDTWAKVWGPAGPGGT